MGRKRGGKELALLALLGVAGCTPPVVFTVATAIPAYDVHQCVTEGLVEGGFRVVESRREDGIVKSERQGTLLGFPSSDRLDIIDVVIYERADGRTGIQYTAGRLILDEGKLEGPDDEVEAIAQGIADYCSD
jgi:hypothetical protein